MKMKYLLFVFIICSAVMAQAKGPKISFNSVNYDFGKIDENAIVSYDFIVSNNGDDSLVISDVRPGCGCTAAKPEKSLLLPGDTTKIHIEFNSIGRNGSQHKYVYVFSNDKETPETRLSFTAFIEKKDEVQQTSNPFDKTK